ncbi:unnamed protein product [Tetraodon nigroviridis]|uniref:(spotted green pufferfish) hypothetical protein n=1 Tax=Tetraodon nigroviridis TaxID=99883 RepID=Q4T204_TETNG|nr:unnamed protein product [Tetraodon nigroviridis]
MVGLFLVYSEIRFDLDAFPQCRGAEAEATHFCSVRVSKSETLAPPTVQRDAAEVGAYPSSLGKRGAHPGSRRTVAEPKYGQTSIYSYFNN